MTVTTEPILLAEMHAHEGKCVKCGFIVKMLRDSKTGELRPDLCCCVKCGQRYYMEIPNVKEWEALQWRQKADRLLLR